MKVTELQISGLKLLEIPIFRDNRGFFAERYNDKVFAGAGVPERLVQFNHSRSVPGVLRGLHFQREPMQGKLVSVVRGKIWDVAVDIRKGSPTFGKHVGVELNSEEGKLLWIPAGFAHGFCVLGDEPADVVYQVDNYFNQKADSGFRWDDRDVAICWPIQNPTLSARDLGLPSFHSIAETLK
jgi:dTDP-4-dehydrorhamnose 3,5-epimerase